MGMLGYCILYAIWGVVDIINLLLIYKHFFMWKKKEPSKKIILCILFYISITFLWAYSFSQNISAGIVILYLPFYLKAIPVILCYFEKQKLRLVGITVLIYHVLIALIGQTAIFVGRLDVENFTWKHNLVDAITSIFFMLIVLIMIKIKKNSAISLYFQEVPLKIYYILCIVLYIMGTVENTLFNEKAIVGEALLSIRIHAILLLIFISWLIVEIVRINQQKVSTSQIAELVTEQMKGMTEYYNELSKKETELHRFRHDVKNLLIVLHSMIEQQHYDKALEYIENMEAIYKNTVKGFDTGNIIADALLNTKMQVAAEGNTKIIFDGFVPTQKIEDLDISILLSNILDNAIEACQKIDGEKEIRVESVLVKRMWILTVKNPVQNEVAIKNNKIRTSKANKELHGYGLLNMRRVVEKYQGDLQLSCDNGEFTTKANLFLGK